MSLKTNRRNLLKGVCGGAAVAVAARTGLSDPRPAAAAPTQSADIVEKTMSDSCFVNLNQPQRYQTTRRKDLDGRTRFPVLDTRQIREINGAELRFHQATKRSDPVLEADPRWETGVCIYGTVHHDGERFRLWYQPLLLAGDGPGNPYAVSYAESSDGIHWERPSLGLVELKGSKENNLTTLRGHGPSVIDLGPAAPPERRYLGIAVGYAPILGVPDVLTHDQSKKHHGYWAFYSADGLDWKVYPPPTCCILPNMSDTACFVGDPYRGRVIGSVKLEPRVRLYDRRSLTISTARMDAVTQWTHPRLAIFPDELDDRMAMERGCRFAEFYGMGMLAQRDVIVGFPEVYWVEGELHPSQTAGVRLGYHGRSELQMAYSYDGYAWHRSIGREPFIPMGREGEWDDGFLTAQSSAVEVGDDVYIYYTGNRGGHSVSAETDTRKVGLATIKKDRFASIASDREATVDIYHGRPAGKRLAVNGRTRGQGTIRVEACVPSGKNNEPIVGFTVRDSVPLHGDDVSLAVAWKAKRWTDLPRDSQVVLRFYLENAEIFAYEIV